MQALKKLLPIAKNAIACVDRMSTGLLHLAPDGSVIASNTQLYSLFGDLVIQDKHLNDLLNEAEKFGFLAAGVAAEVASIIAAQRPTHLFRMRDGRTILLTLHHSDADGLML